MAPFDNFPAALAGFTQWDFTAGDPLQDMASLGQLELVVAAGRLHRPAPALG